MELQTHLSLDKVSVNGYPHNPDIRCLDPKIILNPSLPDLICRYHHVQMRVPDVDRDGNPIPEGFLYECRYSQNDLCYSMAPLIRHRFHPEQTKVTFDFLPDCVVIDDKTGLMFPIYLVVPCGHCILCEHTKLEALASRMTMESQMYDCYPWHIVLTYRDQDRPKDGVNVRDVQLFLKRLRISLVRLGWTRHIRYFCVSEYSPNGREHYHIILWNIRVDINNAFTFVRWKQILDNAWQHGWVLPSIVSPQYVPRGSHSPIGKIDNFFSYITKYLSKDEYVPIGKNPNICLSSRGKLYKGIGFPFISSHLNQLRKSLNVDYEYLDWITGTKQKIVWSSYMLDKVFPTFNQSVPLKLRHAVKRLNFFNAIPAYHDDEHSILLDHFSRDIYIPSLDLYSPNSVPCRIPLFHCDDLIAQADITEDVMTLNSYYDFDFATSYKLAACRSLFVPLLRQSRIVEDNNIVADRLRQAKVLRQERRLFYE